ncbi:methyl-accepting chemotaxis protein [Altererythrobacter sp.]|uniref:methyl-accepting chemotaxis protein n=1 Tax=Altererythrobacter sp. TaxID=1872480 RepID=UPI003CFF3363
MTLNELGELQRKGIVMLVTAGWATTFTLAIMSFWMPGAGASALLASVAVNIIPTYCAWQRRFDMAALNSVALTAAAQPAILLYAMRGADWQIDMHMYFFVGLAMLSILCEWRPIVVAAAFTAVHHLVLAFAAPSWVFANGGGLDRVLVHALAVVLQAGALIYIVMSLRQMFTRLGNARDESNRLTAEAKDALAKAAQSEAEAEAERERRRAVKEEQSERQREELLRLAAEFESSVSGVASAVSTAAASLDEAAASLDGVAQNTGRQATELAGTATQTSQATRSLANSVANLSQSIALIADNARQQSSLSDLANSRALAGDQALQSLADRSTNIGVFTQTISKIATQTNLLALNASIEAARAGLAGKGFSVVAQEINDLARRASTATDEIGSLLGGMSSGAEHAEDSYKQVTSAISELTGAALAIQSAVEEQRHSASGIEMSADETALGVDEIAKRIGDVAASAGTAERLSGEVKSAAGALLGQAEALQSATNSFVRHLRAA